MPAIPTPPAGHGERSGSQEDHSGARGGPDGPADRRADGGGLDGGRGDRRGSARAEGRGDARNASGGADVDPHSARGAATARRAVGRRVEETSAGGLVLDRPGLDAQVVLIGRIDRRGRLLWSLPKGHVEAGETQEDTAVREVAEETGISGRVIGRLGSIDFWFTAEGRRVHKTVHHFLLLATGGELSDADVEVSEVAWVPLAQATGRLAYPTERELLTRVPIVLAESA